MRKGWPLTGNLLGSGKRSMSKLAKHAGLAFLLTMFAAGPLVAQNSDTSANPVREASSDETFSDEESIYSVIESYVAAFNAGDADRLAEHWSEQGEYLNRTTGDRVRGRDNIRAKFAEKFEKGQRPRLEVEVASIRFVNRDVGLEEGIARIFLGAEDPQELTYTTVFVREGDSWKIDSTRETFHQHVAPDPENSASPLHELAWLIGTWRDDSEEVVLEIECRWATNESFLVRSFRVEVDGVVDLEGTQVLGWDAADETIRGWVFDSDGGFAHERWHREDDKWWIEGAGTLPDGRKASSQRCLRAIDADSYEIHTTGRSIEGEIMPDIGPFVVRRKITAE